MLEQGLAHVYAAMTPNPNMQIATVILNQRCSVVALKLRSQMAAVKKIYFSTSTFYNKLLK